MATCSFRVNGNSGAVVDRRTFIRNSSAAAILPWNALNVNKTETVLSEKLVDAHVHVWTPNTRSYPLAKGYDLSSMRPASFTPAELMVHAKPVGVNRVVLIQMSYYGFDNSYMLDVIEKHGDVYSGVAVIDEDNQPVPVMKELKQRGVRGFRIQPQGRKPDQWLGGQGMKSMWKTAADENLAMCHLINPGFLPSVERMCDQFKSTPVVIDHFARIGVDGQLPPSQIDNLCRLSRFEKVSVKVSAYYALGKKKAPYQDLGPMIQRLLAEFGANRLMWGSDCPFQVGDGHDYAPSINLVKTGLDFLRDQDKHWILRKTAEKVFFS
ncbi:MAG: amidohydrolase family protein [Planctomycetota bacterium]|nr:amidohydrolase family protein [Planctomycetota bacterium]